MKNIFIVALLSGCMLNQRTNAAPIEQITGEGDSLQMQLHIRGINDGTATIKYYPRNGEEGQMIDSVRIKKGSFRFTGRLKHPEMLFITMEPGGWTFQVFAENTKISVEGDTTGAQHVDDTKYGGEKWAKLEKFQVKGSQSHEDFLQFSDDPAITQYDPIIRRLYEISSKQKNKDEEYRYRDMADSVRQLQTNAQLRWIDSFASIHPSSVSGAYLFGNLYQYVQAYLRIGQTDSILKHFSGEAAASDYYLSAAESLAKRKAVSPGHIAPDFTLLKRDSTSFTLSSLRGKYVMIDFWASWCHPCRQAIPHWKKVYAEYHPKGLEMVSVSDDSRWPDWKKAMDVEKMPWTQVCDEFPEKFKPARVGEQYLVNFIPFYVLLDKEGRILVYSANEQDIVTALKNVM